MYSNFQTTNYNFVIPYKQNRHKVIRDGGIHLSAATRVVCSLIPINHAVHSMIDTICLYLL